MSDNNSEIKNDQKKRKYGLDFYIEKHGEEEGRKVWSELNKKRGYATTLPGYIERYGQEIGAEKYKQRVHALTFSKTLPGYIQKYGEIEGKRRYEEKNKKLSVGTKALRENGYTEEQILEIKNKHASKSARTLENYISKYGEENGKEKYEQWMEGSKKRSIWCIDYYLEKGFSEEYAKAKISNIQKRDLEYFLLKYGEQDGRKRYLEHNRKKSTSLDMCIEKYGEEVGRKKFEGFKSKKFSKKEIEIFEKVISIIGDSDTFYYEKNQYKIGLRKELWEPLERKTLFLDFFDSKTKRVVEFNGDIFHANPRMYKDDDLPNPFNKNLTAKDIWEYDAKRNKYLESLGFEILIIWESDYIKNKQIEVEKVINFLRR